MKLFEVIKSLFNKKRCSDCKIKLNDRTNCGDEMHNGKCCDCFDESLGMLDKYRSFPRPGR